MDVNETLGTKPVFSIITPSFNQGAFIERTVLSVLSQNGPALEYVVMDGGSHDDTLTILQKYDGRLRWISEKDGGQADAINRGIQTTSGDLIGWLNSDDIYYPGALQAVADCFNANPDLDVVYGQADHIDLRDRPIEPYPTEPWDFRRLFGRCYICQPATFIRRRVVERFGLLDPNLQYCMDFEYWLRLGAAGARFGFLERKLAGSRMYPENKTMRARLEVHAEINDMFKKRFGKVPNEYIFAYAHILTSKKFDRIRQRRQFRFTFGCQSLVAARRWNGAISAPIFWHSLYCFIRSL